MEQTANHIVADTLDKIATRGDELRRLGAELRALEPDTDGVSFAYVLGSQPYDIACALIGVFLVVGYYANEPDIVGGMRVVAQLTALDLARSEAAS